MHMLKMIVAGGKLISRKRFLAIGAGLGSLVYRIGFRKKVLHRNLTRAFGWEESDPRLKRTAEECCRYWGMFMFDMFHMFHAPESETKKFYEIRYEGEGAEELKAARSNRNRPVIFFVSHYSSIPAYSMLGGEFENTHGFLSGQNSEDLVEITKNVFRKFGMNPIIFRSRSKKALVHSLKVLKENGALAIAADQNRGKSVSYQPFFGHPAPMPTGLVKLPAYDERSLINFCSVRLRKDLVYELRIRKMDFPRDEDPEDQMRIFSKTYNRMLEEVIAEEPAQYFWLHKRWKTLPGGEPSGFYD